MRRKDLDLIRLPLAVDPLLMPLLKPRRVSLSRDKDYIPPQGQTKTYGIYPPQGVKGVAPPIPAVAPPPPPPTDADDPFDTLHPDWTTDEEGSVGVTGGYLYATSYGSGSGWHGPRTRRQVQSQSGDFICDVHFSAYSYASVDLLGWLEFSLMDASLNLLASWLWSDAYGSYSDRCAIYAYRNNFANLVWSSGESSAYNNLTNKEWKIRRVGNTIYWDYDGVNRGSYAITTAIQYICFRFKQYSTYPASTMRILDLDSTTLYWP